MKIVFLLPGTEGRPLPLNGESIRFGSAASSGTDQSVILIGEYLAKQGHHVTIVLDKTNFKTINSVRYTDFTYKGIGNEIDILNVNLWFDKYNDIPFKVNKAVQYWHHMAWQYGIDELTQFCLLQNVDLQLIFPSAFAQSHNTSFYFRFKDAGIQTTRTIIPNPIEDQLANQVLAERIERDPKKVIFHAQYSRGGAIAKRVIEEFDNSLYLKTFDYVNKENGVDKQTILRELASAEYFIFPLYHPNSCVYKDTFSCAVAEAIAMGVKVITYPLGAFTEYFNDGCYYADFPPHTDINRMFSEKVSCEMPYMEDTRTLVDAMKKITEPNNRHFTHSHIFSNLIRKQFSVEEVGLQWNRLIKDYE